MTYLEAKILSQALWPESWASGAIQFPPPEAHHSNPKQLASIHRRKAEFAAAGLTNRGKPRQRAASEPLPVDPVARRAERSRRQKIKMQQIRDRETEAGCSCVDQPVYAAEANPCCQLYGESKE